MKEGHWRDGFDDGTAAACIGISRRTLLRYLKSGKIKPPRFKRGKNRRAWTVEDVVYVRTVLREDMRARALKAFQKRRLKC